MSITQARLHELLTYDATTGDLRWRVRRSPNAPAGAIAGVVTRHGYRTVPVDGRRYGAHRLAWLYVTGKVPAEDIDHIDGDRLNNRFVNLRTCDRSENNQNQRASGYKNNRSGFLGVFEHKPGVWRARVTLRGRTYDAGLHATPEAARDAYLQIKARVHDFQPVPRTAL